MIHSSEALAALEADQKFQDAWAAHVEGNSCYSLDDMSQPEVDAFRFAFACGYIAGQTP